MGPRSVLSVYYRPSPAHNTERTHQTRTLIHRAGTHSVEIFPPHFTQFSGPEVITQFPHEVVESRQAAVFETRTFRVNEFLVFLKLELNGSVIVDIKISPVWAFEPSIQRRGVLWSSYFFPITVSWLEDRSSILDTGGVLCAPQRENWR